MELYVHFPFCAQKCRYCDFASYPGQAHLMEPYADALLREASFFAHEVQSPISTVYFGGGTPSLLPAPTLTRLIQGLKTLLPLDEVQEWTVEANPGTLTRPWLEAARQEGVNRLSLGMQAAQPRLLSLLGRIHSFQQVQASVDLARKAGFENLNLDLIFGLPTQTKAEWQETLEAAFSLGIQHLSAYGLIPEPGTPLLADLEAGKLALPAVEEERDMYETLLQSAAKQGLEQYEISNFARPGYACQHNIGYWRQVPYLGLGVSAASMLLRPHSAPGMTYLRRTNTRSLQDYLSGMQNHAPVLQEEELISPAEARFETMMLGLRMNAGVAEEDFVRLHGVSLESCFGDQLRLLASRDLVYQKDHAWRLTRQGMDLQNMVLVDLMED
ncbi:MAG: radical SAM family heme chaperone HemW [Clostridia bacterium]|nr:radical SAM family heme chaperone HemW [Clostridia bacterium]